MATTAVALGTGLVFGGHKPRRSPHPMCCSSDFPEPDPNFDDGDLSISTSAPAAPRFVPTFSRVSRKGFAKRYELFPGGPIESDSDKEEVPEAPKETTNLPKVPTHKQMIAARRHYLKRQARRGLLPPTRPPPRKRSPADDVF